MYHEPVCTTGEARRPWRMGDQLEHPSYPWMARPAADAGGRARRVERCALSVAVGSNSSPICRGGNDCPAPTAVCIPGVPPQVPARPVPSPARSPSRKRGRSRVASQSEEAPAAQQQQVTHLTPANCVGRHVLCPKEMWPSWPCNEHGGTGWEAVIDKLGHDRETVQVRFVAQSSRTRQWRPMWLQLGSLRPI